MFMKCGSKWPKLQIRQSKIYKTLMYTRYFPKILDSHVEGMVYNRNIITDKTVNFDKGRSKTTSQLQMEIQAPTW